MILTRSPYYLTIDWTQGAFGSIPEKYIIQLYVWSGDKLSVPLSPTYEIENKNPLERTGSTDVDISNYINDSLITSLESSTTTNVIDSNNAIWVKSQVIYYINDVAQTPYYVSTDLALKGYGYGIEGKNYQITSTDTLSSVNFANVSNNSVYALPILLSESVSVDVDVISQPNNVINESYTLSATTDSDELIKNVYVNCADIGTDTSVQIKYNNVVIHTLILKEELRYIPINVVFTNRAGQLQTTTFFKDKEVSLSVTSESYESSNGQANTGQHQFEQFNTNGKTSFKINTGWVKESYNEILKQLILSNKVWELKDNVFIPLNIKKKSLQYQTRQRDRLLNYEFEFDYAFSEINNI